MVLKRTTNTLCTIHTKRNGNINRSACSVAVHRTRGIYNTHHRAILAVEIIRKIIPILLNHLTVCCTCRRFTSPRAYLFKSLSNNIIRVKGLCIYLSVFILGESLILLCNNIPSCESVLINKTCLRRNLIELNFIPLISRHQSLNNINLLTKS